jgi:fucose 4-O-acetylase-like acetyltransferase
MVAVIHGQVEPVALMFLVAAYLAARSGRGGWVYLIPTSLVSPIRYPITVALAISLIAGFVTVPSMLNVSQVLSFLPFFVLGLSMGPEHFALLRRRGTRIDGTAALAVGGLTAYSVAASVDPEWVHWRRSFSQLGVGAPAGLVLLIAALAAALVLTLAFLAVVPARRTWFTRYGSATMYAYLLHGFVTLLLSYQPWYHQIPGWQVMLVAAGCLGLTVMLCSGLVRIMFRWAIEPRIDWLFRESPVPPAGSHLSPE